MRAVIYARVSTEQQSEGSVEEQIRRCRQYCELKSYEVVKIYQDVGSGMKTETRPEFEEMMKEIADWDICVAYKLDRFHRSSGNASKWADELNKRGKNFAAIDIDIDTSSAMGLFIFRLMTSLAQLEVEQTRERTRMGMIAVKNQGRWRSRPPYGYTAKIKRTKDPDDKGILEVDTSEREIVVLIYQLNKEGLSNKEIEESLTSRQYTTRKGSPWSQFTIRDILKNEFFYKGIWKDENGDLRNYEWESILEKN